MDTLHKNGGSYETWASSFISHLLCISDETLKVVGPFYLASMPGEVKDHTRGKCVTCRRLYILGCS